MSINAYADPMAYDREYGAYRDDIPWYLRVAEQVGGPILELGCGHGRIGLELARAGHQVIGVDLSPQMLAAYRDALDAEPALAERVTLHEASFLDLPDLGTFPLVLLPFNTLHHCLNHHQLFALFNNVANAMATGATFAFDCYLPDPGLYSLDRNARHNERTVVEDGQTLHTWMQTTYDEIRQLNHVQYTYKWPERTETFDLMLRYYFPAELLALLNIHGFRLETTQADFGHTPLIPGARKLVATATRF